MISDHDAEPVLLVHDLVLVVQDFLDQPRSGIALYSGAPHRFLCPFVEKFDDYAEEYLLAPISDEALNLEREAWDIYYGHGPVPELPSILEQPIPRFPEAKPRYNEIDELLKDDRDIELRANIKVTAMFKRRDCTDPFWQGRALWEVCWSR